MSLCKRSIRAGQMKRTKPSMTHRNDKIRLVYDDATLAQFQDLGTALETDESINSIKLDPYWPKWDSPWWKAVLLLECGQAELIPRRFINTLIVAVDAHYLHTFPLQESQIPEGCDPYRHLICHCALGTLCKLLVACGENVFERLPWVYDWFIMFQLPDGGYNCDEAAYTKSRKSSFLSTLPMLEAMLDIYASTQDNRLLPLLQAGVDYLFEHRMFRNTAGKIIDPSWLQLSFPRFYNYDVLRGLAFVLRWAALTDARLDLSILDESLQVVANLVDQDGYLSVGIDNISAEGSLFHTEEGWKWEEQARSFPCLSELSKPGSRSIALTKQWQELIVAIG